MRWRPRTGNILGETGRASELAVLSPACYTASPCGPRFVQSEPPTRRSGGLARSGLCRPVSPADVQVDGQTILTAVSPTYMEPLNCTSGRDGGVRTRGLLLPNQLPPVAGRSLASLGRLFTRSNVSSASPDVAQRLRTMAPTLAPPFRSRHGHFPARADLRDRRSAHATSRRCARDRARPLVCGRALPNPGCI